MISDKERIEKVLRNGELILLSRPELKEMNPDNVIDLLNDNEEMIRDRWGVAALLVVDSIETFELHSLIEKLSLMDAKTLTGEYVGYLLQSRYNINLELLLIEADKLGKFDSIIEYVNPNLRFVTEIKQEYVIPFLQVLEKHLDHRTYSSIVSNYARGVANCSAYLLIAQVLGDIDTQTQYELMYYLAKDWYHCDVNGANEALIRFLEYSNDWSKKTAICFLQNSLYYEKTAFEKNYSQIEIMLTTSNELWEKIIPIFVKYVMLYPKSDMYSITLEYLRKIPADNTDAKCSFLQSIWWEKEISQDIREIFQSILAVPFDVDKCPLNILDHIWYGKIKNDTVESVLENMFGVFRANGYSRKCMNFFEGLGSSISKLFKYSKETTKVALKYILTNDVDGVYFGTNLLVRIGDILSLKSNKKDESVCFTKAQITRVIKAVLYISFDPSKICHMAFQLLEFACEEIEEYLSFCIDKVYGNYPETMFEISKNYETSQNKKQLKLVKMIVEKRNETLAEYEVIVKIKDLQPSWDRQRIYKKAMYKHEKQINKKAEEQSFFAQFFSSVHLKYGNKIAHIIRGAKGEKFYQSSPFQQLEKSIEIPRSYVNNPVDYTMEKLLFLEEVKHNALDR